MRTLADNWRRVSTENVGGTLGPVGRVIDIYGGKDRGAALLLAACLACSRSGGGGSGGGWSVRQAAALDLHAIWGSGPDDVWAVGPNTIAHWNGQAWMRDPSALELPGSSALDGVSGSGGNDTLDHVWGSGPNDVWAFGLGHLLHFDGKSWSDVTARLPVLAIVTGLWGSGPDDIWAVTAANSPGTLLHWDGRAWSAAKTPGPSQTFDSVWGASANDVWLVGTAFDDQPGFAAVYMGFIQHWDGATWSPVSTGGTAVSTGGNSGVSVWGTGADDVWVGNLHWDGKVWSTVDPSPSANPVWGTGPNDVWGLSGGQVMHWNGTAWTNEGLGPSDGGALDLETDINTLWGSASNDVWAASENSIYHWDGSSWTVVISAHSEDVLSLSSVTGSGPDDVWTIGGVYFGGTVKHWDGSEWSVSTMLPPAGEASFTGLWASGPNDVWAFGRGDSIMHWDGTAWSESWSAYTTGATQGQELRALWGSKPTDVWAVGSIIMRWDGATWSEVPGAPSSLLAVVGGSGSNDVWAFSFPDASNSAAVVHWDGTVWSAAPAIAVPAGAEPQSVWASGIEDAWVVLASATSASSFVFHWNGTAWSPDATVGLGEAAVDALWGSDPHDLWAVGKTIWHWNGSVWSKDTSVVPDVPLRAVWGSGALDVWAVGELGIVLHR
jgi:hypothetical protein